MHFEFKVSSKKEPFAFAAEIHRFGSPDDFHMDPSEFYEKWGKAIPPDPHYELEIKMPGPAFFKEVLLHVHPSRKDPTRLFVCYPKHMATPEVATGIFRSWCLGTVATVVEGIDLNDILKECGNDHALMEQALKERYDIAVITSRCSE